MANIKKTMAMAVVTTALGATLIAGGSFAIFTSSTQNTGNTFAAGTLVVNLDKEGAANKYFELTNIAPGDSEIRPVKVTNNGTLELRYDLTLTAGGDLGTIGSHNLTLTAFSDAAGTQPLNINDRVLAPNGGNETIYVKATLPKEAGNEYQGKTGTASISVAAEQTKNN